MAKSGGNERYVFGDIITKSAVIGPKGTVHFGPKTKLRGIDVSNKSVTNPERYPVIAKLNTKGEFDLIPLAGTDGEEGSDLE